jgi:hypothetical protein
MSFDEQIWWWKWWNKYYILSVYKWSLKIFNILIKTILLTKNDSLFD